MRAIVIIMATLVLGGCATTRTSENDVKKRVAIDPEGVLDSEYRALRHELIKDGRFVVVDRSYGFKAVVREQDLAHKQLPNRFSDTEKYAQYGELHGAGSVIKVERNCDYQYFPFVVFSFWNHCDVTLTLVDSSSGKVITQVARSMSFQSPRWGVQDFGDLVEDLGDEYPAKYKNWNEELANRPEEFGKKTKESSKKAREDLENDTYQTLGE